jgi:hypothetical protein
MKTPNLLLSIIIIYLISTKLCADVDYIIVDMTKLRPLYFHPAYQTQDKLQELAENICKSKGLSLVSKTISFSIGTWNNSGNHFRPTNNYYLENINFAEIILSTPVFLSISGFLAAGILAPEFSYWGAFVGISAFSAAATGLYLLDKVAFQLGTLQCGGQLGNVKQRFLKTAREKDAIVFLRESEYYSYRLNKEVTPVNTRDLIDLDCAICLGQMTAENILYENNCKHAYHAQCVDKWLAKNPVCPLCKSPMNKDSFKIKKIAPDLNK